MPLELDRVISQKGPPFPEAILAAEPIFKLFYWLFLCPNRIRFDKTLNQYICISGGWVRKVICIAFNLCVPLNVLITYAHDVEGMNVGTLRLMYKIAYAGYLLWGLSCTYIMWARMDDVVEIFNEFVVFNKKCVSIGYRIPRRRLIPNDVTLTYIFSAITLLISTLDNMKGLWSIFDRQSGFRGIGEHTLKSLRLLPVSCEIHPMILYFAAGTYIVTNTCRGICFTHLDLLLACWGIQFKGMIATINENLAIQINERNKPVPLESKVQSMLLYLKFSAILERFNESHGVLVLCGTVAEIFYVSTCSAIFVADNGESSAFHAIVVLTSFLPFLLTFTCSAEVNQSVKKFVSIVKQSLIQDLDSSSSTQPALLSQEDHKMSDAVAHIQHDLEMNSVGFQGLGFFLLSYGFLGSIVTAITTYSLLILQLSEKVKPNNCSIG